MKKRYTLTASEKREWQSLQRKSKKYKISCKRVGPSNVVFSDGIYAQLGTNTAQAIMNARIKIKQKYGKKRKY